MSNILSHLKAFAKADDGATMVEYGLLVALIAVIAVATVFGLGTGIKTAFENVDKCIDAANTGTATTC